LRSVLLIFLIIQACFKAENLTFQALGSEQRRNSVIWRLFAHYRNFGSGLLWFQSTKTAAIPQIRQASSKQGNSEHPATSLVGNQHMRKLATLPIASPEEETTGGGSVARSRDSPDWPSCPRHSARQPSPVSPRLSGIEAGQSCASFPHSPPRSAHCTGREVRISSIRSSTLVRSAGFSK
jgi:hypothetical protein